MRLLDLFCGAGGAAVGYHRAGFTEIVGVDNRPMPRYPFEFVQADALEYLEKHGREFDVIHASPPCQAYTTMRHLGKTAVNAPDLVAKTRAALIEINNPWVIENVIGAPLQSAIVLCGSSFGLKVRRHRLFESSHLLFAPPCRHNNGWPVAVWGDGRPSRQEARRRLKPVGVYGDHVGHGQGDESMPHRARTLASAQEAMGIDWMEWKELTQAIPPAYTEWIGKRILEAIG